MARLLSRSLPYVCACLMSASMLLGECVSWPPADGNGTAEKLIVVASLFPLYDMARSVGGNASSVSVLLPPGVEAHTYEPRPSDVEKISKAGVFIYVGAGMEPWAQSLVDGAGNSDLSVLDASTKADLISAEIVPSGVAREGNGAYDPHLWLDFGNDEKIVHAMSDVMSAKDPADSAYFARNADAYINQLKEMDGRYNRTLKNCRIRVFVTGGHSAFAYLARRYNLTGISAYGLSPDSEPTPQTIRYIDNIVKAHGVRYVLFEDTVSPKVADALAEGTGAKTLSFSPGENLPKEEYDNGVTFPDLLEKDLETLKTALECR